MNTINNGLIKSKINNYKTSNKWNLWKNKIYKFNKLIFKITKIRKLYMLNNSSFNSSFL